MTSPYRYVFGTHASDWQQVFAGDVRLGAVRPGPRWTAVAVDGARCEVCVSRFAAAEWLQHHHRQAEAARLAERLQPRLRRREQ